MAKQAPPVPVTAAAHITETRRLINITERSLVSPIALGLKIPRFRWLVH